MITRREDLHNTWVDVTKDHEVVKLFAAIYDKGVLFGFEISKPYNEMPNGSSCIAISIDGRGSWVKHSRTGIPINSNCREITIKDFMPPNDVKYYDKDEEVKHKDIWVSGVVRTCNPNDVSVYIDTRKELTPSVISEISEIKVSHTKKTKEELMSDNNEIAYDTFQDAKISNADSDIYLLLSGKYSTKKSKPHEDKLMKKCDPRDYCINGFEFTSKGYSLEVGDCVLVDGCAYIELTKCGVSLVSNNTNQEKLLILKSKQMDKSRKDNNLVSGNNNALDKAVKEVLEKTHNEIMSAMPRTKTEYIKLSNNDKDVKFWEVARDFSEIEGIAFYFLVDDSYLPVVSDQRLLTEFSNGNLYRKLEKQVTWHDNAVEFLESISECETFMNAINENKPIELEADDYKIICRLVVESVDKK